MVVVFRQEEPGSPELQRVNSQSDFSVPRVGDVVRLARGTYQVIAVHWDIPGAQVRRADCLCRPIPPV
ncbi:MAG TPA: hypothetical protein VGH01_03460 [Jatrophihabitantaceae bacterium]